MASFAAVVPRGGMRCAFRGARVDEHIGAGPGTDARVQGGPNKLTRPADSALELVGCGRLQRCTAACSGRQRYQRAPKLAQVGRPSELVWPSLDTCVDTGPSADVFVDARAAESARPLPPGRHGGKRGHFCRFSHSIAVFVTGGFGPA